MQSCQHVLDVQSVAFVDLLSGGPGKESKRGIKGNSKIFGLWQGEW